MARPDKAERARRQQLAQARRVQAEIEEDRKLAGEDPEEMRLAAIEENRWAEMRAAEEMERGRIEYADGAVKALDQLAVMITECARRGEEIPLDYARDILREARHPDYLPEPRVPACPNGCCWD